MDYALKMIRADKTELEESVPHRFYLPGTVIEDRDGVFVCVGGQLDIILGPGQRIAVLTDLRDPTGEQMPSGWACYRHVRVVGSVRVGKQWENYYTKIRKCLAAFNEDFMAGRKTYKEAEKDCDAEGAKEWETLLSAVLDEMKLQNDTRNSGPAVACRMSNVP